jgi:integrase
MGIKYDRQKNHYVVTYHRRHPVTRMTRSLRRQGIKTREEAERAYKKLIIRMGEKFNEVLHPLWTDVVKEFLISYMNRGIANNTLKNYKTTLEAHTFKRWEVRHINQITTSDIRDLIVEDMAKYSESHKKSMLKHIRAVFQYAHEQDLITRNPTPKLKFRTGEKIKLVLRESEVKILLSEAQKRNHDWFPIWAMACFTGMRNGELFALRWEKVDLKKRVMLVDCSWTSDNGLKETKSGDDRIVEIANSAMPVMEHLYQARTSDFVLPRVHGWESGYQAQILKTFLKEIKLPLIRFHDLRATWATIMLSKGVEPIKVMSMGGWKDLKTMQIYVRKSGIHIQGITDGLEFL